MFSSQHFLPHKRNRLYFQISSEYISKIFPMKIIWAFNFPKSAPPDLYQRPAIVKYDRGLSKNNYKELHVFFDD